MRRFGSLFLGFLLSTALAAPAEADAKAAPARRSHPSASSARKKKNGGRELRGKGGRRRKREPLIPPAMPSHIDVLGIEPATGSVRLSLQGLSKPPETRLFVLTDDRGRRFVPATANCQPASGSEGSAPRPHADREKGGDDASDAPPQRWSCALTIAPLYRRGVLTGVAMEWGDRAVNAMPGQVRSRWAEARTAPPGSADEPEREPAAPVTDAPREPTPDPGQAGAAADKDRRDDPAAEHSPEHAPEHDDEDDAREGP